MLRVISGVVVLALAAVVVAQDKAEDSPAAAKTRKLLKTKVTVDFKDTRFQDVVDELKGEVKGLSIRWDSKGGVSANSKITYKGKDQAVEDVLSGICKEKELGWYVISKKGNAYDGGVMVRKSDERGYEKK